MVRDVPGAVAPAVGPSAASPRPATVLIIDDEPQIRRVVRTALEGEATVLLEAGTGAGGVALAGAEHPDLIILDLGLPDADGQTICRALRERSPAPIVVLTARHGEAEKIALFDAGADDYVTKPFSSDELRARVRAHLRRAAGMLRPEAGGAIPAGDVLIDFAVPAVTRAGADVHLTRTEWDLLRALITNEGRTMTHAQLFRAVWGTGSGDAQQYLRVYIRNLRQKLEQDPVRPRLIVTEPGVGYRFVRTPRP